MTGKLFKYYFIDANGQYYIVGSDGKVTTTATETAIADSPEGWDSMTVKTGRDETMWGVFQTISAPVKFRGDAKRILEHIYYIDGGADFEAFCRLVIKKRNDTGNEVWSYKTWFDGKVDFSEWLQDEDKDKLFVQVRVIENDLKQIYLSNKDKAYEIPLTGIPEAKVINMQGVELKGNYDWRSGDIGNTDMVTGSGYVFPMGLVETDTTNYFRGIIYFTGQGSEVSALSTAPNDQNSFLYTDQAFTGDLSLTMDFNWLGGAGSDLAVVLLEKNMSTNGVSVIHTFHSTGPVGGTVQNVQFTDATTVNFQSYPFRYFISFFPNIAGNYTIDVQSAEMNINFDRALPDTDCYALRYYDYAKLLIKQAFENQASLQSQYLLKQSGNLLYKYYDLYPYNLFITSGDGIRQASNPVIKGTLSNLLKDMFSRYMAGVGLEADKVVTESLEYFLDKSTKIATITNAINITKRTAKQFIYNQFKVGYPAFSANDLNGRSEVNSQQQYGMPIKTIKEEKDLLSPYKAAVYEIEYLRSSLFGQQTKDNNDDNSIYLLYCNPNPTDNKYTLKKHASGVGGVPNPASHYNVELSPKRNALRHIPFHKSIMNVPDGIMSNDYKIDFISGDRNTAMSTQINGAPPGRWIDEADAVYPADVPIAYAQDKLFIPLILEFEAKPQDDLLAEIRSTPYGYLEVINGETSFNCFILDVEITGSENDSYKFTTLLTPDNDMSQFIS